MVQKFHLPRNIAALVDNTRFKNGIIAVFYDPTQVEGIILYSLRGSKLAHKTHGYTGVTVNERKYIYLPNECTDVHQTTIVEDYLRKHNMRLRDIKDPNKQIPLSQILLRQLHLYRNQTSHHMQMKK